MLICKVAQYFISSNRAAKNESAVSIKHDKWLHETKLAAKHERYAIVVVK